jgi:hypothetical protein
MFSSTSAPKAADFSLAFEITAFTSFGVYRKFER